MAAIARWSGSVTVVAGARILLVEDDDDLRETVRDALEDAAFAVDAVADGEQALTYLRSHPAPQLIVLDLMMPRVSGWDVLRALETELASHRYTVLVVTAAHEAAGELAVPVLRKPFRLAELVAIASQAAARV